jgi:SAM-dependent methyltransferase
VNTTDATDAVTVNQEATTPGRAAMTSMLRDEDLTARMEPFDSFWEAPGDIESGYDSFAKFYAHNYLPHLPEDRSARILVISCGPGYFVKLLVDRGYENVIGIDSFPEKIEMARRKNLPCQVAQVFSFLRASTEPWDAIVAEQELNHLAKEEILAFLELAREKLAPGGDLILHAINGASPLTGSESRAGNFDHYCSFTEYSFHQVLEHTGFTDVRVFPLNLYVFWLNPLNYVAWLIDRLNSAFFAFQFKLVGKSARIFTKKLGAAGRRPD